MNSVIEDIKIFLLVNGFENIHLYTYPDSVSSWICIYPNQDTTYAELHFKRETFFVDVFNRASPKQADRTQRLIKRLLQNKAGILASGNDARMIEYLANNPNPVDFRMITCTDDSFLIRKTEADAPVFSSTYEAAIIDRSVNSIFANAI